MTEIVTYYSSNTRNSNEAWIAYALLPTGKRWQVYSTASTEAEAIQKITTLYESEMAKFKAEVGQYPQMVSRGNREHHLAGKVWMIHSFSRAKQRVNPNEIAKYEAEGWIKGGPRSK